MRRRRIRRLPDALALIVAAALAASGCGSSSSTSTTSSTASTSSATTTSTSSTTGTAPGGPTAQGGHAALAAQSTNTLAVDLLSRLGGPDQNTVFSPYSLQVALAMVDTGAAGETATQIGTVLRTPSATALARANAALSGRLDAATAHPQQAPAADVPRLNIANALWLQSGLRLKAPFTSTLAASFGAGPQLVNFRGQPEFARQTINAWVAARTQKLITNLMAPGSITSRTELVLANAVYLMARWSSPFVSAQTAPGPFFTATGASVSVPFMTQPSAPFTYASGPGYRAVDLPYRYSTLSMLVVMPDPGTIARFEQSLSTRSLAVLTRSLAPTLIDLHMPKFHLAAHTDLVPTLAALGMPVAFSDMADFSGITAQVPLAISAVEHGADLKVDEAGTVAAAATGIALAPTAVAPGRVTRLTLDHPFLLFLRDDSTGTILFAARVSNPAQS